MAGARVLCRARTWAGAAVMIRFKDGDCVWVMLRSKGSLVQWAEMASMPNLLRPYVDTPWAKRPQCDYPKKNEKVVERWVNDQ